MKPKRIQRKRTKGWRMPPNASYVGRTGEFGNPFIGKDAKQMFEAYMAQQGERYLDTMSLLAMVLKDKDLCCWCKLEDDCHGDIWLELANQ